MGGAEPELRAKTGRVLAWDWLTRGKGESRGASYGCLGRGKRTVSRKRKCWLLTGRGEPMGACKGKCWLLTGRGECARALAKAVNDCLREARGQWLTSLIRPWAGEGAEVGYDQYRREEEGYRARRAAEVGRALCWSSSLCWGRQLQATRVEGGRTGNTR